MSLAGNSILAKPLVIPTAESGVLFEGYAIPARQGVQEVTLTQLKDGRCWMLFGEKKRLVGKYSNDQGRTWGETIVVKTADGSEIPLARDTAHLSVVRMTSGQLGMIHGGPLARTGRDGTILFRTSQDEGRSWSHPAVVDPLSAVCISGNLRVLRTGRIVAPVMNWISPRAGGESEEESNSICYSWIYYSDDEGKTWKRSLSELFVSLDQGRKGCYSFEEPVLEELKDDRLLMYGRTELGRQYQSISKDNGTSWSDPQPVQLAARF
jgi:sialidase-1